MPLKALSSDKKGASSCPPPIPTPGPRAGACTPPGTSPAGMGDGAEALGPKGKPQGACPWGPEPFPGPLRKEPKPNHCSLREAEARRSSHTSPRAPLVLSLKIY